MDAVTMIREDHERARALFRQFTAASSDPMDARWDICEDAINELTIHATVEEELFYPAFMEAADATAGEMVLHSLKEHEDMRTLMEEVYELGWEDPDCEGKFQTLMEKVEEHASEEEAEMLPQAWEVLRSRSTVLAEQMAQRKQQLAQTFRTGRRAESSAGA